MDVVTKSCNYLLRHPLTPRRGAIGNTLLEQTRKYVRAAAQNRQFGNVLMAHAA